VTLNFLVLNANGSKTVKATDFRFGMHFYDYYNFIINWHFLEQTGDMHSVECTVDFLRFSCLFSPEFFVSVTSELV